MSNIQEVAHNDWNCIVCGHSMFGKHIGRGCTYPGCDCKAAYPRVERIITSGDPNYLKLLDEMRELHIKKNAGYSGDSTDRWANFRLSETFGITPSLGVMIRMSDKWIRIGNLVKNPKFDMVNESLRDTLMDLASYALIAICLLEEKNENTK